MPQTVLVTGASRGIGRAVALAFGRAGYQVALHYRQSEGPALAARAELDALGARSEVFQADLADPQAAEGLMAQVSSRLAPPQVLVCNAGVAQQKLLTQVSDAEWQHMLAVNVTGTFACCRAALPAMIARKAGRIITLSSVWGIHGASCEAHYSAAKAAVIGLTRALAKEVGPCGITVNCIAPGVIATDMLAGLSAADLDELARATPLGRIGAPEDVAGLALFLASEAAGFITGQVIGVDGGFPA